MTVSSYWLLVSGYWLLVAAPTLRVRDFATLKLLVEINPDLQYPADLAFLFQSLLHLQY